MSFHDLKGTVIDSRYCCGCGLCAAVCPAGNLAMQENEYGEIMPRKSGRCVGSCGLCQKVCPFAEGNEDEDELGGLLFRGKQGFAFDQAAGWAHATFAARVTDPEQRRQAPSGGMTTAVLIALLEQGEIDGAVVTLPRPIRPWFQSRVAETPEQILASRGSVYHVTDQTEALRRVIEGPDRRYAVVSLPCAVKAIRLAQRRIPRLAQRLPYVLGLACGGQRNRCFADLLTALAGSSQGVLRYRSKQGALRANDFGFQVESGVGGRRLRFKGLYGFLMMNGIAKLKSCLFCNDIFAELADAAFMDAWLPDFMDAPSGRNLVISRNPRITRLMEEFSENGLGEIQRVAMGQIEASQLGAIHKKRSGLAARCAAAGKRGWTTPKRPGRMTAAGAGLVAAAREQLQRWETLGRLLAAETSRLRALKGIRASVQAWLTCWRLNLCLRKDEGSEIYNGRAVYFLQGFRPRALLRSLVSSMVRAKRLKGIDPRPSPAGPSKG